MIFSVKSPLNSMKRACDVYRYTRNVPWKHKKIFFLQNILFHFSVRAEFKKTMVNSRRKGAQNSFIFKANMKTICSVELYLNLHV